MILVLNRVGLMLTEHQQTVAVLQFCKSKGWELENPSGSHWCAEWGLKLGE